MVAREIRLASVILLPAVLSRNFGIVSNTSDAVWIWGAALFYFRATITGGRDFRSYLRQANTFRPGSEPSWPPPIRLVDPRVLMSATCLAAPVFLWPTLQGTYWYQFILYVGLSGFLGTLLVPSALEPEPADLSNMLRYLGKWGAAKFDTTVKTLLVGLIVWLVSHIPVISWLVAYARLAFPVTSENGERLIDHLLESGVVVAIALTIIRMCIIARYRTMFVIPFLMSLSFIWISYQYLFDKELLPIRDADLTVSDGLLVYMTFLAVDLLSSLLGAWVASLKGA